MKSTLAAGCAAAAALLSAVACGTAQPAVRPVAAARAAAACPVRHAWADEVTASGRIAWQVSLPTDPGMAGITLQPLATGGEGVLAEENAVSAIRLRDGRRLWRRAFSKKIGTLTGAVYGLWPGAPGTVVGLTGQVSDVARLAGLSVTTGALRWSLKIQGGLLGTQALAGHTLAVLRPNGDLESVDLVTGRVLWSRDVGTSAGPAAAGAVIAAGSSAGGRARGYGARSGRLLWTARGLPLATSLTAADGLFLAWDNVEGTGEPTAITALNPRTGRVAWTFDPGPPVTILGGGPAGVALATYVPRRRIYLVNPATGKVRWSVAAFALAEGDIPGQLVETGTSVVLPQASVGAPPRDDQVIARSAASGRALWSAAIGSDGLAGLTLALLPLASGSQAVAVTMTAGGAPNQFARLIVHQIATGHIVASVRLPELVPGPLTVMGGRILAQPDSVTCIG